MRNKHLLSITAIAVIFSLQVSATNPAAQQGAKKVNLSGVSNSHKFNPNVGEYVPGVLYVKMKSPARSACELKSISINSVSEKFAKLGVTSVEKVFPNENPPAVEKNRIGQKLVDLSLIYVIHFPSSVNMEQAIKTLLADGNIEYAEPDYLRYCFYTPNDPLRAANQNNFLTRIQAYTGWDIWKGDTATVIGIVDSGTDPTHPDLAANLKHNYADPVDGIDNDGDGYIDNFSGWDVADGDNNTTVGCQDHGSSVTGDADEVTDNGVGGCGVAFNCKFLPVKVIKNTECSTFSSANGIAGVKYAADHGCNVINCSWGGAGFSQYEQDIFNYAFINKDVVICAAAGNNSAEQDFLPASYDNVVSVAATNSATDVKASFSNYGYKVDVCAPGVGIYSTVYPSSYSAPSGTSMSSPVASGVAAMIKSKWPAYTSAQVVAQLKRTCDNIDGINGAYATKLGKGRVNLFRALTETIGPAVDIHLVSISDHNDEIYLVNDTLYMHALFTNLLNSTSSAATATLTSTNVDVSVLNGSFPVGALNTFDTSSNWASNFKVRILGTATINEDIPFKITVTDGTYTNILNFSVSVNVDYINVNVNDVATTQTSVGRVGYTDINLTHGLGFTYLGGLSNLYETGLMVYTSGTAGSDCVRTEVAGGQNQDFGDVARVTQAASIFSDFYAQGRLNEAGPTATSPLGIAVTHNTFAWSTNPDRKFVIVEYVIKNNNASALSGVYAGLYNDWDVITLSDSSSAQYNRDTVDLTRRMGIAFNTRADGIWCSAKLLTTLGGFNHYAIDNDGLAGGINAYTGFNRAAKYLGLSTRRDVAGWETPDGDDVSEVVSSGPITIAAGATVKVAFALMACENLSCLLATADEAQIKYNGLTIGIAETPVLVGAQLGIYPNPASKSSTFTFGLTENSPVELNIYNALGEKVKVVVDGKLTIGNYTFNIDLSDLQSGTYYVRLNSNSKSETQQMVIIR